MVSNVITGIRRIVTGKSAAQQATARRESKFRSVQVPKGTTVVQTTSGPVFRSSGGRITTSVKQAQAQASREKAQAQALALARARELKAARDRAIREAQRKETRRKEVARKVLIKASERAKLRKSISERARADRTFAQVQKLAKREKERTIKRVMTISDASKLGIKQRAKKIGRLEVKEIKLLTLELEKKLKKTNVGKVVDVVSGGTLTERSIDRDRTQLSQDVEKFNKKFGGRELSEKAFKEAKREELKINDRFEKINKRSDDLATSVKSEIASVVFGKFRSTKAERDTAIKSEKSNLKKLESDLKSSKGLKKKSIGAQIKGKKKEITRLETGGSVVKILMGTPPPIIPAIGIPKNIKVTFLGTQKTKGNKIITDVVFKVGKKRVGIARGVTIVKGKGGTSVVLGKSGVSGVKFPSGKVKFGRKQVFAGIEKSATRKATFVRTLRKIKISKALRKQFEFPKKLEVIVGNIKGVQQAGVGKVLTAKGTKVLGARVKFPSGKLTRQPVPSAKFDQFASTSAVLTKNDLNLIIGKAITSNKDKIKFIGLIKGTSKVGKNFKLTGVQQQQYKVALQKVGSVIASASAKSKSIPGLSSAQRFASTVAIVKQTAGTRVAIKPAQLQRAKVKTKVQTKQFQQLVTKPKVKQKVSQISKDQQKVRSRLAQVSKTRQKVKQKVKQKTLQQQSQKLRVRLKTLTQQKQVLTNIKFTPKFIPTPTQLRLLAIALPRKKKAKKPKKKPEAFQGFNVFGKQKGKFIKLNKVPLSKTQALDRGAFSIDQSTANTFKVEGVRKVKKLGKLTKGEKGYFTRTKKKYRPFKIRKGRRITLVDKRIEKRGKPRIDTRGEKRGLTLARLAKQKGFVGKKVPVRKTIKRVVTKKQLKNLAKARRVLAQRSII